MLVFHTCEDCDIATGKENRMQKMIMIPEDRYSKMLESYDEAMAELLELREQLEGLKEGAALASKD